MKEGKMIKYDIPIFIPSYHRPYSLKTVKTLNRLNYPMELVYVFIDSETDDKDDYKKVCDSFGCNLVEFDIEEARRRYDFVHRPSISRRAAGMCRNMFFDYAKEHNIDFYCVQDDDSKDFQVRPFWLSGYPSTITEDNSWLLFEIFHDIKNFMINRNIGLFGLLQAGDFIGGANNGKTKKLILNKVMNVSFYYTPFIYRGERGIQDDDTSLFCGVFNEGLFTGSGNVGVNLCQEISATQAGGLTDIYKENKLLNKALITIIQYPSAITATHQNMNGGRLHHNIRAKYLKPCLIKVDKGNNIGWNTYEEDYPFTNEPVKRA